MRFYHSFLHAWLVCSGAAFTFDSSCNSRKTDIQAWIKEALYLFDRSARVLEDAINPFDKCATNPCYGEILESFLGSSSTVANYKIILKRFQVLAKADKEDILIRCKDPTTKVLGIWNSFQNEGEKTEQSVYPVSIRGVGGKLDQELADKIPWWFSDKRDDFMFPIADGEECLAFTTAGNTRMVKGVMRYLFPGQKTKSTWSDIVLTDILEPKSQQYFIKDLHDLDYNPKKEAVNLRTKEPYSVTIMHELMHSHLVGLNSHGEVLDRSGKKVPANNIRDSLLFAFEKGNDPMKNPSTYAWLAVCLSMPWLKFWDRDKSGGTNGLDGRIRVNLEQWDGKWVLYIPGFLDTSAESRALGPYSPVNDYARLHLRLSILSNQQSTRTPMLNEDEEQTSYGLTTTRSSDDEELFQLDENSEYEVRIHYVDDTKIEGLFAPATYHLSLPEQPLTEMKES
ncbi:hypothetical protein V8E54_011535 [Elaphomyces granulatus]